MALEIKRSSASMGETGFHLARANQRPKRKFVVYPREEMVRLQQIGSVNARVLLAAIPELNLRTAC